LNLLLVEDDEDDYHLTRAILSEVKSKPFKLHWAPSYENALEALQKGDWDAVLVDYDLGGHNGLEVIREAVTSGYEFPLIMVTGRGNYELDVEAMEAGAADYISKNQLNAPFLERVIRYAIERKQAEENLERVVQQRTQELQNAYEELSVLEEELRVQNDELAEARSKMEAECHKYQDWFEFAQIGMLVTNPEGIILEINTAALSHLKEEKQGVIGKPIQTFIPSQERPRFRQQLIRLNQTGSSQIWTIHIQPRKQEPAGRTVITAPVQSGNEETGVIYWVIQPPEKAVKLVE
jgi:PAS domain S-box-containing protein